MTACVGEGPVADEALQHCGLPGFLPGRGQPLHRHGLLRRWRSLQEDQRPEGKTVP